MESRLPQIVFDRCNKQMGRLLMPPLLLLIRFLLAGFLLTGLSCAQGAQPDSLPAINNFRAVLQDESHTVTRDGAAYLEWRSDWLLRWDAVPGAVEYELAYQTSEGNSSKTVRQKNTVFKLEVAKGSNPKAAGMATRPMQLATIQSLLAVCVTARFADGTLGKTSPCFEVGRTYP